MSTLLHLVYIHGFQGNDTSFQSFPLHLQERISSRIPPNSNLRVQSSLYPTYKSAKPLSHATKAFLEWLTTQPDGPVILMGHSMGGLLAAEAALDISNHLSLNGRPRRIVGIIAFDTPFLGMHPHVVVSGIASLLPKGGGKDKEKKSPKSEGELNQHPQVHVVEQNVTDDWDEFKKKIDRKSRPRSEQFDRTPAYLDIPSRSSSPSSPASSVHSASSSTHSSFFSRRSPSPFMDRAIDFLASHTEPDDPFVRWFRKHADDPLRASKRWILEKFQFGGCMFDPSGLKSRYLQLLEWNGGLWINYWTQTVPPKSNSREQEDRERLENDAGLVAAGICSPQSSNHIPSFDHAKEREEDEKHKPPRHFVVLPKGLGHRIGGMEYWEKVVIAGVDDEVEAHTGLFKPSSNLEYGAFVDRVADKILDWSRLFA